MKTCALVVIATLATGCASGSAKPGHYVGGVVAGVGGVLILSGSNEDCDTGNIGNQFGCGIEAGMTITLGLLAVLAGAGIIVLTSALSEPDAAPAPPMPPPVAVAPVVEAEAAEAPIVEPTTHDPRLRQFTIQANVAARRGDCLTVRAIAQRIDEMDRSYRYDAFLADEVTAACLK
jgi:hypothetical protein